MCNICCPAARDKFEVCHKMFTFCFSLKAAAYETHVHDMISSSHVLSTGHSPCHAHFRIPRKPRVQSNVLYIRMLDSKDHSTWLEVAKCFRIWDLDARGYYRGMWRMIYKGTPLFIVGVPFSSYS